MSQCYICSRLFPHDRALNQHMSSQVHKARTICCPLCSHKFATPSAVAMHIESTACHGIPRARVTQAVHALDIVPSISIPRLDSAPADSAPADSAPADSAPADSAPADSAPADDTLVRSPPADDVLVEYAATEAAFNGRAYECYRCHFTCATLAALNQHLASPVHDAPEFRCPKCARECAVVSGLVQHLESGACGLAGFAEVEGYAEALTAGFSRQLMY